MRVWEKGASECRPVIGRIGAEPQGDIAPRESGQTSLWSLFTRESGKTVKETEQMVAADSGGGAVSHEPEAEREIRNAERVVSRLQARIVKATLRRSRVPHGAFERLEPCAGKLARTVLRGAGGGNVAGLPGTRRR